MRSIRYKDILIESNCISLSLLPDGEFRVIVIRNEKCLQTSLRCKRIPVILAFGLPLSMFTLPSLVSHFLFDCLFCSNWYFDGYDRFLFAFDLSKFMDEIVLWRYIECTHLSLNTTQQQWLPYNVHRWLGRTGRSRGRLWWGRRRGRLFASGKAFHLRWDPPRCWVR